MRTPQEEQEQSQVRRVFEKIIGRTITSIDAVPRAELRRLDLDHFCSSNPTLILTLTGGFQLMVLQDPEGNGPGWLDLLEGA